MGDENQYICEDQANHPIHRFLKRIGRRFAFLRLRGDCLKMNDAYSLRVTAMIEARRQSIAKLAASFQQDVSALRSIAAVLKWALRDLESQYV